MCLLNVSLPAGDTLNEYIRKMTDWQARMGRYKFFKLVLSKADDGLHWLITLASDYP